MVINPSIRSFFTSPAEHRYRDHAVTKAGAKEPEKGSVLAGPIVVPRMRFDIRRSRR
ncbi:hypothetical protein ACWDRB_66810 [Nonomuraea sp. NPDC003707]